MKPVWEDDRVRSGMRKQLAGRSLRIGAGDRPIGWKVAFGAPQSMETLQIGAPVVGFLTERSLLDIGAGCSLAGWTKPALEPEIAVQMGRDLPPGSDRATIAAAMTTVRPAIELADVDRSLENLEDVIASNIFHRRVAFGEGRAFDAAGSNHDLRVEVHCNGELVAATDDPTALVGDLVEVVGHVADYLAEFGEALRAGDVVITGSTVPLLWPQPDELYVFSLQPLGDVTVRLVK